MAAINSQDGKNVFDPSRRIRAALGEEYAENVNSEAIERLSQAIASNGIRKRDDYIEETREEENDMRLRDIIKNRTTHTRTCEDTVINEKNPEKIVKARQEAIIASQEKLNSMIYEKKSFIENAVRFTTGLGVKDSSDKNIAQVVSSAFRNVSAMATNDAMETTFRLKNDKYLGISLGVTSVVDFGCNALFSGNKTRVNALFDTNALTSEEVSNINKTIAKERIKYGAQHTLASVVLPSALKYGIDKATDGKIDNKIFDAVTSFGVLSEIGKVSLNLIRRANEKKMIAKAGADKYTVSSDKSVPVKGYNDVAKIAINHIINETIDDTIGSSFAGSLIGYKSVVIRPETPSATSKAIKAFKEKDSVPTVVEQPKVVKAAESTKKTTTPKSTSKK